MEKIKLSKTPWVIMVDGSYDNCHITLVYEWTRKNSDGSSDEMGIIVIQPKDPQDSHPFSKTEKLNDLVLVTFR